MGRVFGLAAGLQIEVGVKRKVKNSVRFMSTKFKEVMSTKFKEVMRTKFKEVMSTKFKEVKSSNRKT